MTKLKLESLESEQITGYGMMKHVIHQNFIKLEYKAISIKIQDDVNNKSIDSCILTSSLPRSIYLGSP